MFTMMIPLIIFSLLALYYGRTDKRVETTNIAAVDDLALPSAYEDHYLKLLAPTYIMVVDGGSCFIHVSFLLGDTN